ncbi:MAG: dihydrolipoamide dehydrogenase [Flavobacterium sp.]|jgi:dihydrolipoamide dehydrogenase
MTMIEAEILIIGGGPGGYTAAIRAAQLGFSVVLVEKDLLGGVCLNWGCIPTKSLLHAADTLRQIESANELGIEVSPARIDLDAIVQRSRDVAAQLSAGVKHLMKKNVINVIKGDARFIDKNTIQVGDTKITTQYTIIATGVRAKELPHIKFDGEKIWNARDAMTPSFLPKKLLVIGAGAIGIEFASLYQTLGTAVTVIEIQEEILPTEDVEIAEYARKKLSQQGINIITGSTIDSLTNTKQGLSLVLKEEVLEFDAAILSVGVTGNVETLNLEQPGVSHSRGHIKIDAYCHTSCQNVYAIGDVAGAPCLAHKAAHEANIAVEAIAGLNPHPLQNKRIPACTYSHPQIASIGLTEVEALALGDIRVGRFPLLANGKAIATNDDAGLIKTIFDQKTGELLGAHMIGPGVTEMIQGFAIGMELETTEAELMSTIFPHPTISEAMFESVLSAFDRSINI